MFEKIFYETEMSQIVGTRFPENLKAYKAT